jgi:methyl-accepting chemotaxis protein
MPDEPPSEESLPTKQALPADSLIELEKLRVAIELASDQSRAARDAADAARDAAERAERCAQQMREEIGNAHESAQRIAASGRRMQIISAATHLLSSFSRHLWE